MKPHQWEIFKQAARRQFPGTMPVALIIDSPWIPGYFGITHLRYYLDAELWFKSNLALAEEFPDIIFLPSWWVEYGMAIEPSALGCRITFLPDQPPSLSPVLRRPGEVEDLSPVNPYTDGLMALALERYRMHKQRILDSGHTLPLVAARGPLCLAAFLRGLSNFMVDIMESPAATHKLLTFATDAVIRWLQAQAEVIGDSVEGMLVLDDIPGLLSRNTYLEFAHPYLKQICSAFPSEWIKVYHNDANIRPFLSELPETGFHVLNWTHNIDVAEALSKTGGKICLMGNVAPLDTGVRGSPDQVRYTALEVLRKTGGRNCILSLGGGVSPGMPKANIAALARAARDFPLSGGF
jgi:uroporphyrinogen decarboxylase